MILGDAAQLFVRWLVSMLAAGDPIGEVLLAYPCLTREKVLACNRGGDKEARRLANRRRSRLHLLMKREILKATHRASKGSSGVSGELGRRTCRPICFCSFRA